MVENRQEFQRELEAIEAKVIELFAMVAEDLPEATQALLRGDHEVVRVLAERDQVIDTLYPEIEELVNREIVLQAAHTSPGWVQVRVTGCHSVASCGCSLREVAHGSDGDRWPAGRRPAWPGDAGRDGAAAGRPGARVRLRDHPL
ncbi:MAG: hypothetical protein ACRDOH_23870 [Streptosporangiaceae bacterium]